MFTYNSKYVLMCMAGKCEILGDWSGYKKNRKNAISFDESFKPDYEKVSYYYIYDKPAEKYDWKLTQLISKFDANFFALPGKEYREIRETRNYYDKRIEIRDYNEDDTLDLILRWREHSGYKYGWQMHDGRDSCFFKRWYATEKENLISQFYYLDGYMMGYGIMQKIEDGSYNYLIRKTDISMGRNTCLYCDYKLFESIWKTENKDFFVNWGGSKGPLLKYKEKFGIYEEVPVYFYSIKKEPLIVI